MTEPTVDQVSEGITFSFGERNNVRVSRTLSIVQREGEIYTTARIRTVAQVRREVEDSVDYWMMRCGSPPEFYDGPKWGVWRDYASPAHVILAPVPDTDMRYPHWHEQRSGFPRVYAEEYAVRLQRSIKGATLVVYETVEMAAAAEVSGCIVSNVLALAEKCRILLQSIVDAGEQATPRPWTITGDDDIGVMGGRHVGKVAKDEIEYVVLAVNHVVPLARRELIWLRAEIERLDDDSGWVQKDAWENVRCLARDLGVGGSDE